MDANEKFMQENDDILSMETKEYKRGFQNSIMQFQKQCNFISKKVPANPPKGNPTKEPQVIYLLQVSLRKSVLQGRYWRKENRKKIPKRRYQK
jgi:hypothetical protein